MMTAIEKTKNAINVRRVNQTVFPLNFKMKFMNRIGTAATGTTITFNQKNFAAKPSWMYCAAENADHIDKATSNAVNVDEPGAFLFRAINEAEKVKAAEMISKTI